MGEDASQVREQIAQERTELGETVKALAEKADVKGRAQRKAADSVEQARHKAGQAVEQVQHAAERVDEQVRSVTPDPVVSGVRTATMSARRRPVPTIAFVIVVAVALILGWRLRQRD